MAAITRRTSIATPGRARTFSAKSSSSFVGRNITAPGTGVAGDVGGAQRALAETTLTWGTHISETVNETTFENNLFNFFVGYSMALRRRAFLAFPVQGHFTAAYLKLSWTSTPDSMNVLLLPVVEELAKFGNFSDISYLNIDQSGTDAFDTPNVQPTATPDQPDPGGNTDNDHRALFATSGLINGSFAIADSGSGAVADTVVSPTGATVADVFNRARRAAIEQGVAYFVVMLVHEIEDDSSGQMQVAGPSHGSLDAPSFGGVASALPYDGDILACRPKLGLNTETTCEELLIFGNLTHAPGSTIEVEYSDDPLDLPDGSAAIGGSATTPYTFDGAEVFGSHAEFTMDTAVQDADPNRFWRYRVKAVIAGVTYYGPVHKAPLFVAAGTDFQSAVVGDLHWIVATNGGTDDSAEAIQFQEASWNRIRSLCTGDPTTHPRFVMCNGDTWAFCQTTALLLWPIAEDGSGITTVGTDNYATTAAQVKHTVIAHIVNSLCPYEYVPQNEVLGNHAPYHAHGLTGNNAGQADVTQDTLDALIEFQFIPPASPITGYSQPVGKEGMGHYAFACGGKRIVSLNAGIDSLKASAADAWAGGLYPISLDAPGEWGLHDAVRDWRNGLVSTSSEKWFLEYMHNALIGVSVGLPANYDRSDPASILTGYRSVHLDPQMRVSKFANRYFGFFAHDHIDDHLFDLELQFWWLATMGEVGANNAANGGPAGRGFIGPVLHTKSGSPLGNAGIYILSHAAGGVQCEYIATIISTSPKEWLTGPPSTAGGEWDTDAHYNRSLIGMGLSDGDVARRASILGIPWQATKGRRRQFP